MANEYKNIIVAVDGSKEAEFAFRKSIDVATRNAGATITLVTVIDPRAFSAAESYDTTAQERVINHAEDLLLGYQKEANEAGITNVVTKIEHGSPKNIITKELTKMDNVDLIICGATGLNAVERFLIGSVSEAIVRSAKCDVLVVRTPE